MPGVLTPYGAPGVVDSDVDGIAAHRPARGLTRPPRKRLQAAIRLWRRAAISVECEFCTSLTPKALQ
jgi:hypothetical protein